MIQTQICFQCPTCHSLNTVIKGIRVKPIKSHKGFYHLDIDFRCQDCPSVFSKNFVAPAPESFRKEVEEVVKATHKLEKLRLTLGFDSSNC